jgi:hypothetical protein
VQANLFVSRIPFDPSPQFLVLFAEMAAVEAVRASSPTSSDSSAVEEATAKLSAIHVDRSDSENTLVTGSSESGDEASADVLKTMTTPAILSLTSQADEELIAGLNEVQKDALNRLRIILMDSEHGKTASRHLPKYESIDHMLLRFLRARNYSVDAAWAMLKHDLDWRWVEKADGTAV